MMKKLKKSIKKFVPDSIWHIMRYIKRQCVILNKRITIKLSRPLKNKRSKLCFEVNVAEHCNLNCCGCSNFSPLAEPEFVDVGEFERDFSRLGDIFSNECERIFLIGGEPLLNPEIITLMKIARKHFKKGNIFVFTNGILLTKMSGEFWQACHDNDIIITISAYPIKLDMEAIKAQSEKFGVKVQWAWGEKESERDTFSIAPVNLKGNGDVKLNFAICGRANNCITLSHGRLFTCTFAPHVRHFNKFFNQDVKITEADYVNIYDDLTADEILQRMTEPIPACRYCDTVSLAKTIQWHPSKREISEWQ